MILSAITAMRILTAYLNDVETVRDQYNQAQAVQQTEDETLDANGDTIMGGMDLEIGDII